MSDLSGGVTGSGLGLSVRLGDVLDLALLAVLELPLSGNILHKGSQLGSYLPSGGTQLRDASALSGDSLLLLQASADDAGGDREVLVVAKESFVSKIFRRRVNDGRAVGGQLSWRLTSNIPEASLLPGESHLDCWRGLDEVTKVFWL